MNPRRCLYGRYGLYPALIGRSGRTGRLRCLAVGRIERDDDGLDAVGRPIVGRAVGRDVELGRLMPPPMGLLGPLDGRLELPPIERPPNPPLLGRLIPPPERPPKPPPLDLLPPKPPLDLLPPPNEPPREPELPLIYNLLIK